MDKDIKLLESGAIRFTTGREEIPKNRVIEISDNEVLFIMNGEKFIGKVDLEDYFALSLWAHKLTFDHLDLNLGVVAYNNGYEHKSLPAAVMKTTKGQRVSYKTNNRFDCTKNNLIVEDTKEFPF